MSSAEKTAGDTRPIFEIVMPDGKRIEIFKSGWVNGVAPGAVITNRIATEIDALQAQCIAGRNAELTKRERIELFYLRGVTSAAANGLVSMIVRWFLVAVAIGVAVPAAAVIFSASFALAEYAHAGLIARLGGGL